MRIAELHVPRQVATSEHALGFVRGQYVELTSFIGTLMDLVGVLCQAFYQPYVGPTSIKQRRKELAENPARKSKATCLAHSHHPF